MNQSKVTNRIRYLFPLWFRYARNNLRVSANVFAVEKAVGKGTNSKQNVSFLTGYCHHLGYRANGKQIDGQIEPFRAIKASPFSHTYTLLHFKLL